MQRRSVIPLALATTCILPVWLTGAAQAQSETMVVPAFPQVTTPPPQPVITRILLPGLWELRGARYVWVPPETTPRRVHSAALVAGAYVWRNGAYVWVPTHCTN
jgi:hypothetical protein